MQQVTRFLMFIAVYRSSRLQISQSIKSHALQDMGDSTVSNDQRLAYVPISLSLIDNHLLPLVIDGMGEGCGARRAILQAIRLLLAISCEVLVSGSGSDPGSVSSPFNTQALFKDTQEKKLSTKDG